MSNFDCNTYLHIVKTMIKRITEKIQNGGYTTIHQSIDKISIAHQSSVTTLVFNVDICTR